MNPTIKAQWTAALRSGQYAQAKDYLRTSNGFCCLGVLSDLHARETGGQWIECEPPGDFHEPCLSYCGELYGLPDEVREWAGITDAAQSDVVQRLAEKNDRGATFLEIADYIETHL